MQSSSIETNMRPTVELIVESLQPGAVLSVLDGSWSVYRKAIGYLKVELPPGIYKVVGEFARDEWSQLVVLQEGKPVRLKVPEFSFKSVSPMRDTKRSREHHSRLLEEALESKYADITLGKGARLVAMTRNWSAGSNQDQIYAPIRLERWRGEVVADLGVQGKHHREGDAAAILVADVRPGTFVLTVPTAFGEISQAMYAKPNSVTIALVLADYGVNQRPETGVNEKVEPAIDIIHVMACRHAGFQLGNFELVEAARTAMADRRAVLQADVLLNIAKGKFDDPILGLMAGHILLFARDADDSDLVKFNQNQFDLIVRHSKKLLGAEQPDVVALRTRTTDDKPEGVVVTTPPIFSLSWDLLVEASNESLPDLLPSSLYQRVRGVASMPPYFSWLRADEPLTRQTKSVERSFTTALEQAIISARASEPAESIVTSPSDFAQRSISPGKPSATEIASWAPQRGVSIPSFGTILPTDEPADLTKRVSDLIDLPNSAARMMTDIAFSSAVKKLNDTN